MQQTWHSEQWVWFRGHADADSGRIRLVEDLRFPVIYFILLGDRQIGLDATFSVEELDLGPALNEAVCDFKCWLKFPGANAFLLYSQELAERYVGG